MQLLLCYDNEGVYVNTSGKVSKNIVLQWGEMPTSVAYIGTGQIMGWGNKAIEIRNVDTGHLDGVFMHKKAQKLKFLCERNDKVSIFESSAQCDILKCWFFTLVSFSGILLIGQRGFIMSNLFYDPKQTRNGQLVDILSLNIFKFSPYAANITREVIRRF